MSASSPARVRAIQTHRETVRFPLMELPFVGFLLATVQPGNVAARGFRLIPGDGTRRPLDARLRAGLRPRRRPHDGLPEERADHDDRDLRLRLPRTQDPEHRSDAGRHVRPTGVRRSRRREGGEMRGGHDAVPGATGRARP